MQTLSYTEGRRFLVLVQRRQRWAALLISEGGKGVEVSGCVAPRYFVWVKAVLRKYSNLMETEEQEGFEQKVSKVTKSWVPLLRGEETATSVLFKDKTYNCKRSMGELS